MKAETYSALLKDLQKLQKSVVTSQIATVRRDPLLAAKLQRLHTEAEVGGRLDDFVATAARKSTVLLLLRTVFVRVLEDLGILGVKRIRDEWGFAAFREVAPALGVRAYFAFIFRDLAVDFPALFAPSDDELPLPDEDHCRALWDLWHHPNRDGDLYVWNGDGFDSRFLGDLYQDLDADIRKRYALLQTPPFVEEYMLDHTLTPALAEFDPEKLRLAGERFRLLDPTCGSGHFLIGAFRRLADYWRDKHGLTEWAACERAIEGVWGCDINPHAVEIADFRLLLEVVARTGVKDLERLATLKLNLHAMDSLIPWERAANQGELFPAKDRLDAYATPSQRRENAAFLARAFHVVVGNPPYITPKDVRKRDDYRVFWPEVCSGKFPLSVPFVTRFFERAAENAFVGQITSSSLLTRRFGKKLVEEVLPKLDVRRIVDASLAPIPGHGYKGGVATFLFFARNRPPADDSLVVVVARRRESGNVPDPALSPHWLALARAQPGDVTSAIECRVETRSDFFAFPIVFQSALADELVTDIERPSPGKVRLAELVASSGIDLIHHAPDLFELENVSTAKRLGIEVSCLRPLVRGDAVRDFSETSDLLIPFAYSVEQEPIANLSRELPGLHRHLWPHRQVLADRWVAGGVRMRDRGLPSHAMPQYPAKRHKNPRSIVYAFVASHPHFSVFETDMLVEHSAAVVKPKGSLSAIALYSIVAFLNSSTGALWIRSKFKFTGKVREVWESYAQIDGTKLRQAPVLEHEGHARYAQELQKVARERALCRTDSILHSNTWSPASLCETLERAHERFVALTQRMVALQEELDWTTYASYGLVEEAIAGVWPDEAERLVPGHRPFEILLARREDLADDDEKTAWFSRHGHDRRPALPDSCSEARRIRTEQRIDIIESDPRIGLLETPPYKRRWEPLDWDADMKAASERWLLESLEGLFGAGTDGAPRGTLAEPRPYRLEEIAAAWSQDPRVAAVAGVWTGTGLSVDLSLVAEKLLRAGALPDNPHRVYSGEGRRKLDEWRRVWALQDQEDAWERAATEANARGETPAKKRLLDPNEPTTLLDAIPLPPKFEKQDFVRAEFFSVRSKPNVPRERFILFAELSPNRFGWNGWRDRDRALAQVEAFTLAENDPQQPLPVPTSDDPRRCGVTYGLWESLPDVKRWGSEEEHAELLALAREACRQPRCPCPIVEAWTTRVLDVKAVRAATAKAKAAKQRAVEVDDEQPTEVEPTVSLAARAWVASLFQPGKEIDAAGVWSSHCARLAEPPQRTLPGVKVASVQLSMPVLLGGPPSELVGLNPTQLALVLDDLVASGDLQASGRGNKKRFQLVRRGVSS